MAIEKLTGAGYIFIGMAYRNSTATPAVGWTTNAGTYFGGNTLPMGLLTFSSAMPFNVVTINIEPGGATGFLIDNLTNKVTGARSLNVVYVPFATAATTGIPEKPAPGIPWLMFPGTPKAHIMFVPTM